MLQAVITIGSSQFIVEPGHIIEAPKAQIDRINLVIDGEKVTALPKNHQVLFEDLGEFKGDKVRSFKYHAKSRYRKTRGHRTVLHRLKITDIKSVKAAS